MWCNTLTESFDIIINLWLFCGSLHIAQRTPFHSFAGRHKRTQVSERTTLKKKVQCATDLVPLSTNREQKRGRDPSLVSIYAFDLVQYTHITRLPAVLRTFKSPNTVNRVNRVWTCPEMMSPQVNDLCILYLYPSKVIRRVQLYILYSRSTLQGYPWGNDKDKCRTRKNREKHKNLSTIYLTLRSAYHPRWRI